LRRRSADLGGTRGRSRTPEPGALALPAGCAPRAAEPGHVVRARALLARAAAPQLVSRLPRARPFVGPRPPRPRGPSLRSPRPRAPRRQGLRPEVPVAALARADDHGQLGAVELRGTEAVERADGVDAGVAGESPRGEAVAGPVHDDRRRI